MTGSDEQLLLDLLNSTPWVDGERGDVLDTAWLDAHGQPSSTGERDALARARSVLADVVRGQLAPAALAPFVDGVSWQPESAPEGFGWRLELPEGRHAAARAVLAWDALRTSRPDRLRACANPECTLFLIDRSPANRARWCSMASCGNRMKARRHYRRTVGR